MRSGKQPLALSAAKGKHLWWAMRPACSPEILRCAQNDTLGPCFYGMPEGVVMNVQGSHHDGFVGNVGTGEEHDA